MIDGDTIWRLGERGPVVMVQPRGADRCFQVGDFVLFEGRAERIVEFRGVNDVGAVLHIDGATFWVKMANLRAADAVSILARIEGGD